MYVFLRGEIAPNRPLVGLSQPTDHRHYRVVTSPELNSTLVVFQLQLSGQINLKSTREVRTKTRLSGLALPGESNAE